MTDMIKQMGEDSGAGEVNSIDTGWPPAGLPPMQKQMGEDPGNIDALMSGGHYDPAAVTGFGEGEDITPNAPSMYVGDKKPRVAGGTAGFANVPKVGEPMSPYPDIDDVLFQPEDVRSGLWAASAALTPVTEAPGNSQIVGDMGMGMPREGKFSGPTRLVGDMVTGMPDLRGENKAGGEQGEDADLVGDIVTGMPTDDYPREEHLASEISPEGLTTGNTQGGYAPGMAPPAPTRENPYAGGKNPPGSSR